LEVEDVELETLHPTGVPVSSGTVASSSNPFNEENSTLFQPRGVLFEPAGLGHSGPGELEKELQKDDFMDKISRAIDDLNNVDKSTVISSELGVAGRDFQDTFSGAGRDSTSNVDPIQKEQAYASSRGAVGGGLGSFGGLSAEEAYAIGQSNNYVAKPSVALDFSDAWRGESVAQAPVRGGQASSLIEDSIKRVSQPGHSALVGGGEMKRGLLEPDRDAMKERMRLKLEERLKASGVSIEL